MTVTTTEQQMADYFDVSVDDVVFVEQVPNKDVWIVMLKVTGEQLAAHCGHCSNCHESGRCHADE